MSDVEAWDADDFEPALPSRATGVDDKWKGEDEDDNVKDNWEDEEEEEGSKPQETKPSQTQAYQRPKKKTLAEKIAEKEAEKKKVKEDKTVKEEEEKREMTTEGKLAEKNRLQKIQESDSLNQTKELFGIQAGNLDSMVPGTADEFIEFRDALKSQITVLEASPHYAAFVTKLINDLAVGLEQEEVKKLGIAMNSLYHQKERQKREAEKKKRKKNKATIKVDRAEDFDLLGDPTGRDEPFYEEEDDDDFV